MTGLALKTSAVAFYDFRTVVGEMADDAVRRINQRLVCGASWSRDGGTAEITVSEADARQLLDTIPARPETREVLAEIAKKLASPKPTVRFIVRQRTALSFNVVREMTGLDVVPVEEEATFGPFEGEDAANEFADNAAARFGQHYPTFKIEVVRYPKLGRRPGQAYAEHPGRAANDEQRLTPADCLEPRLPAVGSFW
jgi:hypothetical protein